MTYIIAVKHWRLYNCRWSINKSSMSFRMHSIVPYAHFFLLANQKRVVNQWSCTTVINQWRHEIFSFPASAMLNMSRFRHTNCTRLNSITWWSTRTRQHLNNSIVDEFGNIAFWTAALLFIPKEIRGVFASYRVAATKETIRLKIESSSISIQSRLAHKARLT